MKTKTKFYNVNIAEIKNLLYNNDYEMLPKFTKEKGENSHEARKGYCDRYI